MHLEHARSHPRIPLETGTHRLERLKISFAIFLNCGLPSSNVSLPFFVCKIAQQSIQIQQRKTISEGSTNHLVSKHVSFLNFQIEQRIALVLMIIKFLVFLLKPNNHLPESSSIFPRIVLRFKTTWKIHQIYLATEHSEIK